MVTIARMETLLNLRQIAIINPGPPTIVDMANDIPDDSTVSVMTGESVGQTTANGSLQTQSLEQVTATLQNLAQVVITLVAPTAEQPEGPVSPPIIPVVAPPRDTSKLLEWLVPILYPDPDNPPSG